jgi:arylsulfatase A-like enzyme|tara:strand:+ start:3904 stop:4050 length:147 start_codon:yes stop_codon:yes gene_type:complete
MIAAILRIAQGYMAAQSAKEHLDERNHVAPATHGFDEFCGKACDLNIE